MGNKFKNLKIVQKSKEANPKLKWLSFAQSQDIKTQEEYIKMITSEGETATNSDEQRLEAMVREQLLAEFPTIKSMKSYEFLVTAVMHNLKKKQLQANDSTK